MSEVLEKVTAMVEAQPHDARSLLLYALISTLSIDKAGYLFKLIKLREMDRDTRRLAYDLMELMAEGGNQGGQWEQAVARMNEAVRKG